MQLQVRWKDTNHGFKEYRYRKQVIQRRDGGWIITTMDDTNVYHCIECAENAIDERLGARNRVSERRKAHGIHVVGSL